MLVSCDSDLMCLARRLREEGLEVYGFGERKVVEVFRNACNNREHRGLDRILYPAEPRASSASRHAPEVAFTMHRIGLLLRRLSRRRCAA